MNTTNKLIKYFGSFEKLCAAAKLEFTDDVRVTKNPDNLWYGAIFYRDANSDHRNSEDYEVLLTQTCKTEAEAKHATKAVVYNLFKENLAAQGYNESNFMEIKAGFEGELEAFEKTLAEITALKAKKWNILVTGAYGYPTGKWLTPVNRIEIRTDNSELPYTAITVACAQKWVDGKLDHTPNYKNIKTVIDRIFEYMNLPIKYGHSFEIDFPNAKYPFTDLIVEQNETH